VLSGTTTQVGTYPITITARNGIGSPVAQGFSLTVGQPPSITSANSATTIVGAAGSFSATATGFPTPTFGETGMLPAGVTFTPAGVLSGTPAPGSAGTYAITITATNAVSPAATQSFTLHVVPLGVTTTSLPNGSVYTKTLNSDGTATLEVTGNAKNFRDGQGDAKIDIDLTPANFIGETTHIPSITVPVKPADNLFSQEVVVHNPQLWWTWDLGAQNLYKVNAKLRAGGGSAGNVASATFGIRTISRDADLSYRLNGQRIFIRGVWYPMVDYYASRANRQTYERDLKELRATYANHLVTQMMEKDEFYDLCDDLGLLIFVQMPFTQFGPYQSVEQGNPRREPFIRNSREQVRDIVLSHRNHPSIIQWSPLAEAHYNGKWTGPQEGYDYFIAEMEKVVRALSPDTIFHPSLCDMGEAHTWNANYRFYNHFEPQLISEYGEISPPNIETWREALTPEQMWSEKNPRRIYNMPVDLEAYKFWNAWEYNDDGFGVFTMFREVHTYIDQNPTNAQELVDDLQLQHAFTLGYATDAFRRKMHTPINGIRTWAAMPEDELQLVQASGLKVVYGVCRS